MAASPRAPVARGENARADVWQAGVVRRRTEGEYVIRRLVGDEVIHPKPLLRRRGRSEDEVGVLRHQVVEIDEVGELLRLGALREGAVAQQAGGVEERHESLRRLLPLRQCRRRGKGHL